MLIKSGAWSDKAETEVQRRDKTRGRRERQGKMACVCKCFTTAVVLSCILYQCTGWRPVKEEMEKKTGKESKKSKKDQKKLLLRRLPSRSVDGDWARTHMASVGHLTSGRRGGQWAGRGS